MHIGLQMWTLHACIAHTYEHEPLTLKYSFDYGVPIEDRRTWSRPDINCCVHSPLLE